MFAFKELSGVYVRDLQLLHHSDSRLGRVRLFPVFELQDDHVALKIILKVF